MIILNSAVWYWILPFDIEFCRLILNSAVRYGILPFDMEFCRSILNSAVRIRYWICKVWTAPGLTPIDQSGQRMTAEQVIAMCIQFKSMCYSVCRFGYLNSQFCLMFYCLHIYSISDRCVSKDTFWCICNFICLIWSINNTIQYIS